MSVAIVCASHTPLMYRGPASNETEQRVRTAFERLGAFVKEFEPDYVIQFAPDHFNGFFYDLMPSFCVGAGAVSLGDWGGGTGPLDVPEKTALELVDHVTVGGLRRRSVVPHAGRSRLRPDVGSSPRRFQIRPDPADLRECRRAARSHLPSGQATG